MSPRSAAKVTFALGLSGAGIVLVGLFALYLLALASGALRSVDGFFVSLGFGSPESSSFHFHFLSILPGFILGSLVVCGSLAVAAGMAAVLYNTLAEIVGGVEVITRER